MLFIIIIAVITIPIFVAVIFVLKSQVALFSPAWPEIPNIHSLASLVDGGKVHCHHTSLSFFFCFFSLYLVLHQPFLFFFFSLHLVFLSLFYFSCLLVNYLNIFNLVHRAFEYISLYHFCSVWCGCLCVYVSMYICQIYIIQMLYTYIIQIIYNI